MGRSANVHLLMALQRAETSVIDGTVRIILRLELSMKNLSVEISRWYFG